MPSSRYDPTVLRWYIALELSRLRKQTDFTLKDVAARLGCSVAHVGHLETGRNLPSRAELEVVLELYRVGARIPSFVELLDAARRGKDWWLPFRDVTPSWFELMLGLETAAARIECYDSQVINGLFQTPTYSEALIRAVEPRLLETEIARRVELWQARQSILTREIDPPQASSVLDESALYGTAAEPEILYEQLEHLIALSDLPNVSILVLPMSARPHAGVDGSFRIMSFADLPGAPSVAYTDGMIRGSYHQGAAEVARFRMAVDSLYALARDPRTSRVTVHHRATQLAQSQ
ncbi:helix-turn-helix domain-containing protein [Pseudonocardia spinosispora]|uniref:helix-turn-helix domain-containing protein n=1 Tax=Pseudonocardia spinosispora TaxID=103441 RepID=UPI00041E5E60|nr:helix-turn-helix transcriptional regulator [Pseudonocardia spinosispora]